MINIDIYIKSCQINQITLIPPNGYNDNSLKWYTRTLLNSTLSSHKNMGNEYNTRIKINLVK